ncbi:hypothetical protein D3C87_1378020 [compost metagenome]
MLVRHGWNRKTGGFHTGSLNRGFPEKLVVAFVVPTDATVLTRRWRVYPAATRATPQGPMPFKRIHGTGEVGSRIAEHVPRTKPGYAYLNLFRFPALLIRHR